MSFSRRHFLRVGMTGAAVLPFAKRLLAADLAPPTPRVLPADEALLDELERAAFDFYWNEADPHTGLIRDRANADGGGPRTKASIAATGFGLTALCIGHERRFRPRGEIQARVRQTLHFLANQTPTENGLFYHFLNPSNGTRHKLSEVSPVDTAILLCGALTCREQFSNAEIQRDATTLYHRVDWNWAMNGGETFAGSWTPEEGFTKFRWDSYCESMMLYLLAMGSPTHPIPAESWHAVRRPKMVYAKHEYISSPAPLFVHQYSHAWFDFRDKHDDYANYFQNSIIACQAHREFCTSLSHHFPSYSDEVWGITASDSTRGYVAWGGPPLLGPIDGSVVPAASAGSLPFLFNESLTVLRTLRSRYEKQTWRRYGFVDAFNPITGWASKDVLGIDVGISMLMAENARSQYVWDTFMRNPEVEVAMGRAGFLPDGFEVPAMA
jgi:hypothetical protein